MKLSHNPFSEVTTDLRSRHSYLVFVISILFLLLLLRLWQLQVIKGSYFKEQSESNRTRIQDIAPGRGLIKDRNGVILADNRPSYELTMIKEDIGDTKVLATKLSRLIGMPFENVMARFELLRGKPIFEPVVIFAGLSQENLVALETHRYELPGVNIQVKPQRIYPLDRMASHVIGYLGEITQSQLERDDFREHRMGDLAGQSGVEREWDQYLYGARGKHRMEVDASGRCLRIIKRLDPSPGYDLKLTLDSRLQRLAQEALGDKVGAIVALDPNNGEILAMVSTPTYSQNDFVDGISQEKWKELLDNPLHPLENRTIGGQYPPGSTFKIVTATAALEEGVITPETILSCNGEYPMGDTVFHCYLAGGHGAVHMHRALRESCDVYFYELGRRLGIERLAKWARAFGLGQKSGLGLPNERPGVVPDREWKKEKYGTAWRPGETLPVAIGQGYNVTTPLQMAQVVAVAANGGTLYRSHIVQRIADADGRVIRDFTPEVVHNLNLKPQTVDVIRRGLAAVVNEPGGTGGLAKLDDVAVGGKTGTAQVVTMKKFQSWSKKNLPVKYRDHAWFVAFAPVQKPQIAVAVLIEHGGHGGSAAAPIAKQVLDAFFHTSKSSVTLPNTIQEYGDTPD
ncbi:MAG: penicillin-binding protein 2 [Deltaproteobacteria bacterium]|nr:penicillin-binding protein 2 [Deltaproteobacteria bacterium]